MNIYVFVVLATHIFQFRHSLIEGHVIDFAILHDKIDIIITVGRRRITATSSGNVISVGGVAVVIAIVRAASSS